MPHPIKNAAMLWTGGKDSSMALYEALQDGYRIRCLVTFAPPGRDFLAHPLSVIRLQAQALELPHHVLPIEAPFEEGYENSLRKLRDEMDIDCLITGDIADVQGHPNWIRERSRPIGMTVHTPLWGRDRSTLLRQLLDRGFRTSISCINTQWLDEKWVGRELNESAVSDLGIISEQTGLDLCGEEGEYHTLVIDGPQFTRGIDISSFSIRTADSLAYMDIHKLELIDRAA
jgi:diphthine-ammonia ligase